MANKSFSLGQVNITDWLIVRVRLASDPGPEITRQAFGPAPPTTQNFSFTDLQNALYLFDVYESSDGILLTTLLNTFEIDVETGDITTEWKFYVVGRGITGDPVDQDSAIVDPYLDGKQVIAFEQRGVGPLIPSDEWTRNSTGVALVTHPFNQDDVYVAVINYKQANSSTGNTSGLFATEMIITGNTLLDSTYYGAEILLNGAGTQLVVTLDHVATVPDGTPFLFTDEIGGAQLQTKIVPQIGDSILWNGAQMSELWVGKGEFLWLKKSGTRYRVVMEPDGLSSVGKKFSATTLNHVNAYPENNTLWNADDLPRLYWWIVNKQPNSAYVIDDNLDQPAYVRPDNRQGQFIVSLNKRKFRMPDTQNLTEKGMASFAAPGGDATRLWDFPGGYQGPALLQHNHITHAGGPITGTAGNLFLSRKNDGAQPHRYSGGGTDGLGGDTQPDNQMTTSQTGGSDNIVANTGVIHMRCA